LPDEKKKGKEADKADGGKAQRAHVPAVHDNGSCFWGIEKLHLTDEAQEARGVARNPVVRPAGEVELPNLSDLMVTFLRRQHSLYFSSTRLQLTYSGHHSLPSRRGLNKHYALVICRNMSCAAFPSKRSQAELPVSMKHVT